MKIILAATIALALGGVAAPAAQAYAPGIIAVHSGPHVDTRDKWRHKCRRWQLYYHRKICRQYW